MSKGVDVAPLHYSKRSSLGADRALPVAAPLLLAGHAVATAVHLHSGTVGEEELCLLAALTS